MLLFTHMLIDKKPILCDDKYNVDGLMQKRRNSIANALH